MAALRAILKALRRVVKRDLLTLWSIKVNNFFLFVALLIYGAAESGMEPESAEPLLLLLGILLLFPVSSDPLDKIPRSRLRLWPLDARQRAALRAGSFALSPVLWITFLILIKTARPVVSLTFLGFAAAVHMIKRGPAWTPLRYIPQFPGRLGGLIRNDLRELLSVLDPYLALTLSAGGAYYRFAMRGYDAAAAPVISILIALAMSTYAQSLFGLDVGSGMTRYRLLPLQGWQILLAKDVAFLVVLSILLLPVAVGPGLTFGFAALALGHHSSVYQRIEQKRWRFAGGRLLPVGAVQAVWGIALGFGEQREGVGYLVGAAAVWGASLAFYGGKVFRD